MEYCLMKIFSVLFIILIQVENDNALSCYICNSAMHKYCSDPIKPEYIALVNCSDIWKERNVTADTSNPLCRKTVQKIGEEYRYIRDCGYLDDGEEETCRNKAGSMQISSKYCKCKEEGCNRVNRVIPSISTFFMCIFFITFNR